MFAAVVNRLKYYRSLPLSSKTDCKSNQIAWVGSIHRKLDEKILMNHFSFRKQAINKREGRACIRTFFKQREALIVVANSFVGKVASNTSTK